MAHTLHSRAHLPSAHLGVRVPRSHAKKVALVVLGSLLTAGTLMLALAGMLGRGKLSLESAGVEWALPLVVGGVVGVLAWTFLVDRTHPYQETPKHLEVACPTCGRPVLESWRLCPYCGAFTGERSSVIDAPAEN